jgi:hypothetical protein
VNDGLVENLPEVATPVSEASQEWHDVQLLRIIEGILYNPERLAAYVAKQPDGRDFQEFVVWQLGGRSQ